MWMALAPLEHVAWDQTSPQDGPVCGWHTRTRVGLSEPFPTSLLLGSLSFGILFGLEV